MVRALAVIPARFGSARFPGKPLALLGGSPMIEHVWRRARMASRLESVVVATDDDRIADACRRFGAEVEMTSPEHASGTDRVAEAALKRGRAAEVVVNVQGDEVFVSATALDHLLAVFEESRPPEIATLAEPIRTIDELFDPNSVKVVTGRDARALYFSRAPIPYHRGTAVALRADFRDALGSRPGGLSGYRKHQGIYAFRRDALFAFTRLSPSPLEREEGLEQLRALEAGMNIRIVDSDFQSLAVDTPSDLERAEARLAETSR